MKKAFLGLAIAALSLTMLTGIQAEEQGWKEADPGRSGQADAAVRSKRLTVCKDREMTISLIHKYLQAIL